MLIYNYNDSVYSILYNYSCYVKNYRIDFNRGLPKYYLNIFTEFIIQFLNAYFHPILINNILIFLTIALSFLFSCLLFMKFFRINKTVSLIFSVCLTLTIYFIFRIISTTLSLYLVFFFPLMLILLLNKTKPFLLGLLVFIILSFSNYYGFFSSVLICFWYFSDLVFKNIKISEFFKETFLFLIPLVIGVTLFFFPLLKSNVPLMGDYTKKQSKTIASEKTTVYRPIEDWYNLSFRPWYFFIPPKSSIFFGELSKNIHKKIQNTGHYLADDYMEEEMAGSYMGWHFLIGLGVVVTLLLIRKFKGKEFTTFKSVYENREVIYRSFFIIFCILLISGPPSFTIKGIKIYTPTYLLYYIVPVFRTLVRWAVVIYLFVLIINSFLVQDLYNLMKNKFQKILFIISFLSLNFVVFAIKIPVININKPPQEIAFVKEKYPESVPYAVYPKGDYYSIFWIISHEDLLINPVNFMNHETGFDSNEFSKNLITEEGIKEFLKHNPKYLIYYPENISDEDLEKINKINNNLENREDIRDFFEREIGNIAHVGNVIIFEVR